MPMCSMRSRSRLRVPCEVSLVVAGVAEALAEGHGGGYECMVSTGAVARRVQPISHRCNAVLPSLPTTPLLSTSEQCPTSHANPLWATGRNYAVRRSRGSLYTLTISSSDWTARSTKPLLWESPRADASISVLSAASTRVPKDTKARVQTLAVSSGGLVIAGP